MKSRNLTADYQTYFNTFTGRMYLLGAKQLRRAWLARAVRFVEVRTVLVDDDDHDVISVWICLVLFSAVGLVSFIFVLFNPNGIMLLAIFTACTCTRNVVSLNLISTKRLVVIKTFSAHWCVCESFFQDFDRA